MNFKKAVQPGGRANNAGHLTQRNEKRRPDKKKKNTEIESGELRDLPRDRKRNRCRDRKPIVFWES